MNILQKFLRTASSVHYVVYTTVLCTLCVVPDTIAATAQKSGIHPVGRVALELADEAITTAIVKKFEKDNNTPFEYIAGTVGSSLMRNLSIANGSLDAKKLLAATALDSAVTLLRKSTLVTQHLNQLPPQVTQAWHYYEQNTPEDLKRCFNWCARNGQTLFAQMIIAQLMQGNSGGTTQTNRAQVTLSKSTSTSTATPTSDLASTTSTALSTTGTSTSTKKISSLPKKTTQAYSRVADSEKVNLKIVRHGTGERKGLVSISYQRKERGEEGLVSHIEYLTQEQSRGFKIACWQAYSKEHNPNQGNTENNNDLQKWINYGFPEKQLSNFGKKLFKKNCQRQSTQIAQKIFRNPASMNATEYVIKGIEVTPDKQTKVFYSTDMGHYSTVLSDKVANDLIEACKFVTNPDKKSLENEPKNIRLEAIFNTWTQNYGLELTHIKNLIHRSKSTIQGKKLAPSQRTRDQRKKQKSLTLELETNGNLIPLIPDSAIPDQKNDRTILAFMQTTGKKQNLTQSTYSVLQEGDILLDKYGNPINTSNTLPTVPGALYPQLPDYVRYPHPGTLKLSPTPTFFGPHLPVNYVPTSDTTKQPTQTTTVSATTNVPKTDVYASVSTAARDLSPQSPSTPTQVSLANNNSSSGSTTSSSATATVSSPATNNAQAIHSSAPAGGNGLVFSPQEPNLGLETQLPTGGYTVITATTTPSINSTDTVGKKQYMSLEQEFTEKLNAKSKTLLFQKAYDVLKS